MRKHVWLIVFLTFSTYANWAEETLKKMTLDEKIGQLLMIAIPCNPDCPSNVDRLFTLQLPTNLDTNYAVEMIKKYHVGGILYICEGEMQEQVVATNYFQRLSKIPLFIAQDFEPGLVRLNDVINYPRARTLAQVGDVHLTYKVGQQIGLQAKRLGVHIVFAPVVDVQTNEKNPVITTRSFGCTTECVVEHGVSLMHGLQDAGIIACAKHFPGHGDTNVDSHTALPLLEHDRKRLDALELVPFKALINEGVQAVMPGHLLVPKIDKENPSSLSPIFIKNILHDELGFQGLIFTDGLIMKALTLHRASGSATLQALLAGCSMAVFPDDVPRSFEYIQKAVKAGELSEHEIDIKVLLILHAKERLGLDKQRLVDEHNVVADVCTQSARDLYQEIESRLKKVNA